MNKQIISAILFFSVLVIGCENAEETKPSIPSPDFVMGELPPQTEALLQEEFAVYRRQHPEMDEATARHEFDIIQKMSAQISDPERAAWAERKALAKAWIKVKIEEPFKPDTIKDDMVQDAIDAYAYRSGHPALVTASHILIRKDSVTSDEERRAALEAVRQNLLKLDTIRDSDLRHEAIRLTHAGFRADMNANLTFPSHPMKPFLDQQLSYQAVVQPFADAAFALSNENPLSEVTETEFGYHLILFKSRTEEKKASIEKDRDFLVKQIVKTGKQYAADQFITELLNSYEEQGKILIDSDRMKQLASTSSMDTE